ncbi:LPS O-antigen length regulator [Shewanella sp. Scap07]|uniref:Wzz/FepE/Etk N-terminal domain-containing protein n=1 Tax=Shewanella sp. Scap07 TaxID=2589987 RepID=UPI0015BA0107|nr:Wzz/FepE/Etk N-terminal domain-containing protein [Shewanella sp. Scap07]QLE86121.1 LPS O-antigen length regulator [Shewanella sp. Scap07]
MQKQEFEIDIKELFSSLLAQKWLIVIITSAFAIGSVLFALSKPNVFKAEVLLAPVSEDSQISTAASQLGGIAAMAGFNIGASQGSSRLDLALETLKSRTFTKNFIENREILVPLMAMEKWDSSSGTIVINPDIYDVDEMVWVREVDEGKSSVPTAWEAYKEFNLLVEYEKNPSNGFVRLSVSSESPVLAQQWAKWLVEDINTWIKKEDVQEFEANISYIQQKISETKISEMQRVFYQLIEEQTKKLMLAEVQEEYVFKVIDPAVVPEEKAAPSRALICVLGSFLGGFLAIFIALIRHILIRK